MTDIDPDFSDLRALFINCTLKRSPEISHTEGLIRISSAIMERHGVGVEVVRAVERIVEAFNSKTGPTGIRSGCHFADGFSLSGTIRSGSFEVSTRKASTRTDSGTMTASGAWPRRWRMNSSCRSSA